MPDKKEEPFKSNVGFCKISFLLIGSFDAEMGDSAGVTNNDSDDCGNPCLLKKASSFLKNNSIHNDTSCQTATCLKCHCT